MPVALERALKRQAAKEGLHGKSKEAYVYGTMRKTGWKPGEGIHTPENLLPAYFASLTDHIGGPTGVPEEAFAAKPVTWEDTLHQIDGVHPQTPDVGGDLLDTHLRKKASRLMKQADIHSYSPDELHRMIQEEGLASFFRQATHEYE